MCFLVLCTMRPDPNILGQFCSASCYELLYRNETTKPSSIANPPSPLLWLRFLYTAPQAQASASSYTTRLARSLAPVLVSCDSYPLLRHQGLSHCSTLACIGGWGCSSWGVSFLCVFRTGYCIRRSLPSLFCARVLFLKHRL
jgi:hypothetical protein